MKLCFFFDHFVSKLCIFGVSKLLDIYNLGLLVAAWWWLENQNPHLFWNEAKLKTKIQIKKIKKKVIKFMKKQGGKAKQHYFKSPHHLVKHFTLVYINSWSLPSREGILIYENFNILDEFGHFWTVGLAVTICWAKIE